MAIFQAQNLTYYYPVSKYPAIKNLNLEINDGEMILLVGASGCGKSTLLKLFAGLVPNFYGGVIGGRLKYRDVDIIKNKKALAPKVGILFQDPERQIILTDVERDMVFGMENLGLEPEIIKRRLAETSEFLGIREITGKRTAELSAGQKQKVALASILAMNPEVLLLDEPTSQMDPISTEEILNTVRKIAEDTGRTIIMAEQKLERCLHLVDRVIAMETGSIRFQGNASEYCRWAVDNKNFFLPVVPKLFADAAGDEIPLTIKQGRIAISKMIKDNPQLTLHAYSGESDSASTKKNYSAFEKLGESIDKPAIKIKNLWYAYNGLEYVLKDISLDIKKGQFVTILGQNGAGKSTLIKNINGLLKPLKGNIEVCGVSTKKKSVYELSQMIGFLSQNPDNYIFNDTVEEEIRYTLNNFKRKWNRDTEQMIDRLGLTSYKKVNPRDLSTGEKQRVAIASVLSVEPEILILDEPTRGIDYKSKNELGRLLMELNNRGSTIILVTHDVEFAAEYSKSVVIMFNGEIAAQGDKRSVLKDNLYYCSQLNKLFYGIKEIFTVDKAREWLKANSQK